MEHPSQQEASSRNVNGWTVITEQHAGKLQENYVSIVNASINNVRLSQLLTIV